MKKKASPKRNRELSDKKRVLIVDDHPFLRAGLGEVLGKEPWHGHSTQEIGARLGVSTKTVEAHRLHIKTKLGIGTATELTAYAARWVETGNWSS